MHDAARSLISFLAILNPLALSLYLVGLMEELDLLRFARVLFGACVVSLAVFVLFAITGETFLVAWLGVRPDAMRAFGGVIFIVVGYHYAVKGYRTLDMLRGSLDQLPSAIALPFMIGAGTITQSILIGKHHPWKTSIAILALGIGVSFLVVFVFKVIRDHLRERNERLFDRYANIIARINGLLIGTIATEMIVSGLHGLWRGQST